MGQGKTWTAAEKQYLEDNWGIRSMNAISQKLNRSANAIKTMVQRQGLGAFLSCGEYVTFHQLLIALGCTCGSGYKKQSWIDARGFPVKQKKVHNNTFQIVYLDDFWEWAEQNKAFLDFSKFEKHALGNEPGWVAEKRRNDFERSRKFSLEPWSVLDDEKLIHLLNAYKYTCREISLKLGRTEGAVIRRIRELNLKQRPVKEDNHRLYAYEDYIKIGEMIKNGAKYEQISAELNRSVKALRGRVFDMYLTESLDKVRKYIGNGQWGDNRPDIPIRYRRLMQPEEKDAAGEQLSKLAYLLLEHAKKASGVSEEYKDYFQKDMCRLWDDVKGCTAGETSCDYCTDFVRIQAQYCTRCGAAIFSRDTVSVCEKCRIQRKKQAQRKWAVLNSRKR